MYSLAHLSQISLRFLAHDDAGVVEHRPDHYVVHGDELPESVAVGRHEGDGHVEGHVRAEQ